MKALEGNTRRAMFYFCASHIIFTTMLDGQSIAQPLYPQPLQDLSHWYVATFQDPLMSAAPGELVWFQSLICCELLVQLPFFCCGCYYFGNHGSSQAYNDYYYPGWFRSYCIAYGAHTATTMVPILTTLVTTPSLSSQQMYILLGFYLPYLFFPLWILQLAVSTSEASGPDRINKKNE